MDILDFNVLGDSALYRLLHLIFKVHFEFLVIIIALRIFRQVVFILDVPLKEIWLGANQLPLLLIELLTRLPILVPINALTA